MRALIAIAAGLLLQGCAYHRLSVANPNPADPQPHRVHSSAIGWGAFEQQSVATKCTSDLLSEVRVRTSLAQSLATVVTLGFWQPATIEYRCAKPPTQVIEVEP